MTIPPLLTVIPLSLGTLPQATALLQHLRLLGIIPGHAVLMVADHGMTHEQLNPLAEVAKAIFPAGGSVIHSPLAIAPPYPHAHNLRFETAARHVALVSQAPWLWLDPLCTPTCRGWLMMLESEYRGHAAQRPFLGCVMTPAANGTARPFLAAPAIYPATLPKRMLQRLVAQRGTDFEQSCADLVIPLAHPSKLIVSVPGGSRFNGSPAVTLVHAKECAELRAKVAAALNITLPPEAAAPPPPPPAPEAPVARNVAYYHSGNLGDVIYALSAIKLAGGGRLLLGPIQRKTSPASSPIKEPAFTLLKPLLDAQPFLTKSGYTPRHPGTDTAFDLNTFRTHWHDKELRSRLNISTLAAMHAYTLGVHEKWHPEQTWLTVPNPIRTGMFTVHRSPRYRAEGDAAFPWPLIVKRYAPRLLFVGLANEHAEFQRTFSTRIAFYSCRDFLDLAQVIAGSEGFIGNQSFPCSLALGCGQRVLQESWPTSPDCLLRRASFLTQPFTESALDKWEKAPVSRL